MRRRLLINSLLVAVIPFLSIVLSNHYKHFPGLQMMFVFGGAFLQILVVLLSRSYLRSYFRPSMETMEEQNVPYIPAALEPGKYKADFIVTGIGSWLGVIAPLIALYAQKNPAAVTISVLNFVEYTAPDMDAVMWAIFCIIASSLCIALWFRIGQAVVIANEMSDRKRYLYRGYAEMLDADIKIPEFMPETEKA